MGQSPKVERRASATRGADHENAYDTRDYRVHGEATIDLSHNASSESENNTNNISVSKSAFSLPSGPHERSQPAYSTSELQQSHVFDGHVREATPQSTQKGNFVYHSTPPMKSHPPPKHNVDLSMPNVDSKNNFQSSYQQSHTGELPSESDRIMPLPSTTFNSSLNFSDGEASRPPYKSTQQQNYTSYPTQDVVHYTPPKPQINLTMPNVDPKDTFNSSYKQSHTGEPQSVDNIVNNAPNTTFQSSLHFNDGEAGKVPLQSTQQGNYVVHPAQDVVHYMPPRPQIDITQPNVNPKENYQSSYKQSHRGDTPSVEDEVTHVPRTTFQSSVVFEGGDNSPAQSTQQGSFTSYPAQDREVYHPPRPQVDLSQPNVNAKESYTSSYKQSHTGEPLSDDNVAVASPHTAFTSSITMEDADRNRTPRRSTQRDNFVSHPNQEVEHPTPPRAQINLNQPGVDSRDVFQSSYKNSHTGEPLPQDYDSGLSGNRNAFQSSIALEDADRDRTPKRSTQQDNYVYRDTPEVEHYVAPRGQINLVDPNVDPKSVFQSSYKSSHKGELPADSDEVQVPRTAFTSTFALEDADGNSVPRRSTQQDNYVHHDTPEFEHSVPPKAQISLAQPNVDPKDTFQSSYKSSHTGEAPSDYEVEAAPRTAFKSNITLEDADNNRTPRKSTQQDNYVHHSTPDIERHAPPKAQINISQPNVDPKESFQSSYKSSHRGDTPSLDDEVVSAPRTAFKSNILLEDADNNRTPRKSTQQDNYRYHSTPEPEHYTPPQSRIDLSQPNVDPREAFTSSYKNSHKGEPVIDDDSEVQAPRTTFKSSFTLEDADNNKTPRKSTQQENFVQHYDHEVERPTPPKSHLSLAQANVDPKDAFTSSYKNSHKGEPLAEDDEVHVPRSAFKSNIALEDADKNRTPRKSTQQDNYRYHSTPEPEHYTPPQSRIDLSQPNVDPKEAFTSSYKNSHKGEAPLESDEVIPRTAFKSSFALEDADKNKTPRKSTQQDNYVHHYTPEMERPTPPKSHISLAQPNVDPKESFQSSYKNSHRGDTPSVDDEVVSAPRTAFKSNISLEDADNNRTPRKSTQQDNYKYHSTPEPEHYTPPQSRIDLSQPNVDPKDAFTSSYKSSHKGEPTAEEDEAQAPRTAFKSSLTLEDADKNRTPRKSTQQENYVHHYTPEMERPTPPKSHISLAQPNVDPKDAFTSSYKNSHKGELLADDDEVQAPRTAFKSSFTLEDADKNKTPRKSTQKDAYPHHETPEPEHYTPPKSNINLSQPNVDPKDSFQSSYKNSHRGDTPSLDDEVVSAPRTAFKSNILLEDADNNRTPRKSTQQDNYRYHSTPEPEHYTPPQSRIDLSQPNVDPREAYTSSYKNSHKGESIAEEDETQAPRTAFKSSFTLEDADKNRTPRKSTQQENYVHHYTPEMERPTPPKSHISLAQSGVDPKEAFVSSYKQSHKGESVPDEDVQVPRTAFKSTFTLEDADKNKTPRKSTQKDAYPHHETPEPEHYTPPKSQVNLSQPNVDPAEAFRSSYKNSHRGEMPSVDDEVISAPRSAFKSNITLEDADNNRTPRKSTQQENYRYHSTPEPEYYAPPKPQINLSQPNVDPKEAFQSSYNQSMRGETPVEDESYQVPRTAFKSNIMFDEVGKSTPQSTQKGEYVAHPISDATPHPAPKPQVDLSMPNVDPKESFVSSYKNLHKGELPSEEDRASPAPQTAFKSNVVLDDGDRNRTPQQSTQRGEYVAHPVSDAPPTQAPKGQVDLSMPNVDPRDTFKSSYNNLHTGELPPASERASPAPTAFKSNLVLDDGERDRTPQQSTQRGEYVAHPVSDTQPTQAPKAQIDFSMPHVDPKERFQSSYKNLHTGELPPAEERASPAPTAFKSNLVLDDGERNRTPQQSTQRGEYVAHPVSDTQPTPAPKPQIDFSMPNVDPKDRFQSSYKNLHKGELPLESERASPAPTAFKSNLVLDDGERDRTPQQSTQRGEYVAHPVAETQPTQAPKAQIDFSMPHVDPKDRFQSSYKNIHTGELPPAEERASPVPSTAFKSNLVLDDGERNRTPQQSTQRGEYVAHPVAETQPAQAPKAQVDFSMPDVDPKDRFQSSYKNLHKGELPPASERASPVPSTAFKSSVVLDDGERNRVPQQSTQRGEFPVHQLPKQDIHHSPKPQVNLSQPDVNQKDMYQSSYQTMNREPILSSSPPLPMRSKAPSSASRNAFRSSFSLDEGTTDHEPLMSTARRSYAGGEGDHERRGSVDGSGRNAQEYAGRSPRRDSHDTGSLRSSQDFSGAHKIQAAGYSSSLRSSQDFSAARRSSQDAGRSTRSSIVLGNSDTSPRTSTSSSMYARPPQEAIAAQSSPAKPRRLAFESSVSLGEKNSMNSTPVPTSRDAYTQRPSTPPVPAAGRARAANAEQVSIGNDYSSHSYNTTSSASFASRPQTAPASPSRQSGDLHRSNIQFSSGEPVANSRVASTSRSSYAVSPSSPSRSPTTTSSTSPYNGKTRSSISFGNDQSPYNTTNRTVYNSSPTNSSSPTLSPSRPSSPSPALSPSRPSSASSASRQSQLRSSFSLG